MADPIDVRIIPKECPRSRYYQRRPVLKGEIRNVLAIPKTCPPGYLELWSPDALVEWTVTQSEDGRADARIFRSGPASKCGVYLPRGGEAVAHVLDTYGTGAVLEYNGFVTRTPVSPEVRAKFYPDLIERPKLEVQRFAIAGPLPGQVDRPTIPVSLLPVEFAFPPHYCITALVTTDAACTIQILSALDGLVRQSVPVVGLTTAVPVVVGDFEVLTIVTGQAAVNIQVLWTEKLILYP